MLNQSHDEGYYPPWLTDKECGEAYKAELLQIYDAFYNAKDKDVKKQKLDELYVSLTVVSDVIAYRYLVKYYSNLFRKLGITVEEYLEYKVERMYTTIKDKKDKIDDILSYVYMSFMLSSPRLIYDYAEKIGRCKLVRENAPYFQIQRLKFFFIERENTREHIVFNVDNIDLDENTEAIRSNLDKYSLSKYHSDQSKLNADSGYDKVRSYLDYFDFQYKASKEFLLNLFDHWKSDIEDDFYFVRQSLGINNDTEFTMLDYIRYKYENNQTKLNYDEYLDVLSAINNLLKSRKDLSV